MHFVRYTGEPRDEDVAYARALNDPDTHVLDPWSTADENIEAHFMLGSRLATVDLPPHARDLFDLAAMVYIADEIVPRDSADDRWTRALSFTVPVADLHRWIAAEKVLNECLSFLSGDMYAFEWIARPANVPGGTIHRNNLGGQYDAVCLFSGGVDSLLGAVALLDAGKRVLLVGHYADGVTSSAQRDLYALLERKYPGRATLLQANVERSRKRSQRFQLPDKVEITHRSRSFLFLAAGTVAALATGTTRLYIPENGLIALNAPLGPSRRGTLSTRTAHPRYIDLFNQLLAALGFVVHVENPFWDQSKTDMLRSVTDPEILTALLRSVSCAHAGYLRWEAEKGVTHCGYCVPCLYRRVGFLAAGVDEPGYLSNVFTELPQMSEDTARDFRLLVRFALAILHGRNVDVIAAVLRHGGFSGGASGDAYTARGEMLKRWASSFVDLARARSNQATRRIVGL